MNKKDSLSDERLVSLHHKKRVNAFFTLYNRYKNYGYAVIYRVLEKYKLVNALKDERDAIFYDAIMKTIECYDGKRGTFRKLFISVITHLTIERVREFSNDPLSDYISLDANVREDSTLRFADSLTFADQEASPPELINLDDETKKVNINCQGLYKRRIDAMTQLKESGFSNKEIAHKFKMSDSAVRSVFYRIKHRIEVKDNNKIKK